MPVIQRILTPGRAHKSLTLEMLGGLRAEDRGGQSLRNNLIAFWPGDEASGNLIDAHTNGLDLNDVNTVTSNPGQVYDTARQYTRANSEYHVRPGDDAILSIDDNDATICLWVYADTRADNRFLSKGTGDQYEYFIGHNWYTRNICSGKS